MTVDNRQFHIVCRDCRTETVVTSRDEAERLVDQHISQNTHQMTFARVD